MTKWSVLAAAALCGACASAPAAQPAAPPPAPVIQAPALPAPVDAVGVFDFTTSVEGNVLAGTLTVVKTDAGYGGSVTTNMTEPIPVRDVVVEGQKLTVTGETPDGPLTFTMEFKGDDFSGTWSLAGMSGTHQGKRRKG